MAKLIGTAGHVDHGKTTLIRALTGIDADRLPEEKRRGMTIDVGFAYVDLPQVGRVSIVDVPGHERFLTNMLVGALGIDVALLCVATDESVMPQTREHLQILDLLPVERLVVAMTRADLADEELQQFTQTEISELLSTTRFAGAPILPVSTLTGTGLDALRDALTTALLASDEKREGSWYLPIDRAFVVKGYGTVVTGTLARGSVAEGDQAIVLPGSLETRIRGVRRHDVAIERAEAGMRVALNLGGVKLEQIRRGQTVGQPGSIFETSILDASVRWIGPVKHGMRIRVSIGADEAIGKLFLSDAEPDVAQLRLESVVAAALGQPLIIRRYSPPELLAGGLVVVPQAKVRRKGERVQRAAGSDDAEAILSLVRAAPKGLDTDDLCRALGKTAQALGDTFERLKSEDLLLGFAGLWITPENLAAAAARIQAQLLALHQSSPTTSKWPREKVIDSLGLGWRGKPLDRILAYLASSDLIRVSGTEIAHPDFQVTLTDRQAELLKRVTDQIELSGINGPSEKDLAQSLGVPIQAITEILRIGTEAGQIIRIDPVIYYTSRQMEGFKELLSEIGAGGKPFTAAEVRDRLQTSRKYIIPLLEYFDSIRFTLRQGENRVIQ